MGIRRTTSIAAVFVLTLAALVTGPGSDAVTHKAGPFRYVTVSRGLPDGGSPAQISVMCPSGTKFTGAGAALPTGLSAGFNYIGMTKGGGTLVTVTYGPNPKGKKVKITAVCVKNLTVTHNFGFYSVPPMSVDTISSESCGANTLIGGGGGDIDGQTFPHENYPSTSTSWTITANNATNETQPGLLIASCIPAGSRSVQIVQTTANLNGGDKVSVPCPKGTRVSSGGFQLGPEIRASVPYDGKDADRVPDDGWRLIAAEEISPGSATVHAVCVGKPPA